MSLLYSTPVVRLFFFPFHSQTTRKTQATAEVSSSSFFPLYPPEHAFHLDLVVTSVTSRPSRLMYTYDFGAKREKINKENLGLPFIYTELSLPLSLFPDGFSSVWAKRLEADDAMNVATHTGLDGYISIQWTKVNSMRADCISPRD